MSVADEIAALRRLPFGPARTAAAEAVTRRVETEGPEEHLAWALGSLVEAYTFDGVGDRSPAPFARMLQLWDERPELFDEQDRQALFWEYKWIAEAACESPQRTRAQVDDLLADMERRFRLAGQGSSAVAVARFDWAWVAGDSDADERRLAWRALPEDEFDDCPACVIGGQVEFLLDQGRYAEAVELGRMQRGSCNVEPTKTRHATALAALLIGDPTSALEQHLLALSTAEGKTRDLAPSRGCAFELLARGGQLERALRALRNEDAELLERAASPLDRLFFLLGVLAGLSANLDRGELTTGFATAGRRTVAELHGLVLAEARELAELFDRRHGNTSYAARIERALSADRSPHRLDFSVEAASRALAPGAGAATGAAAPAEDGLTGADPVAAAERFAAVGDHATACLAYAEAADRLERDGAPGQAGLARAEAAQCAAIAGDEERAHAEFARAAALLDAASAADADGAGGAGAAILARVLTAWAPLAARMAEMRQILRVLAGLLARLERGRSTEEAPDRPDAERTMHAETLARVRDTLARSIASALPEQLPEELSGASAAAEAMLAAEEFARIGRFPEAAHAFWLAGRVQRDEGDDPAAVYSLESAFEGFTIARSGVHRAEVAGELIALLRADGLRGRADEIIARLTR